MIDFSIEIASSPDREQLVAEIWYKNQMIAEINQEKEDLELEFYLKNNIAFNYEAFCKVLDDAKKKLLNG